MKRPKTAERAAILRSHHSASSIPPATAGPSIAAITGLSEPEPRRAHRTELAVRLDRPRLAFGDRLEIGPGAERAASAGQHRDVDVRVGVEALEGLEQSARAVARSTALRRSGRSIVTIVTRSSVRVETVPWLASRMARFSIEGIAG